MPSKIDVDSESDEKVHYSTKHKYQNKEVNFVAKIVRHLLHARAAIFFFNRAWKRKFNNGS